MSAEMRIVKQWDELMQNFIKNDMTFLVHSIKKEDWGYNLMVTIPPGRTFDELEKLKDAIKVHYPCNVEMEIRKLTALANVKIITKDFSDIDYKPVKLPSNQLLLGYDLTKKPIIVDMNTFPHVLIAGMTGMGKSRLLLVILSNLIFNYNNDLEIHICVLSKSDHKVFKFYPCVKSYLKNISEIRDLYYKLNKLREKREDIIEKAGCINIKEYNEKHKNKMNYIYISADEFSLYMPDDSDEKDVQDDKKIALAILKILIKEGRSAGIFIILGIQVSTYEEMPTIIRRCCNVKITFKQSDAISSKAIINCGDATELQRQEFIILTDEYKRCKTPNITHEFIKSYLTMPIEEKHVSEHIANAQLQINYVHDIDIPKKFKKFCERIIKPVEDITNYGGYAKGRRRDHNVNAKGQKST